LSRLELTSLEQQQQQEPSSSPSQTKKELARQKHAESLKQVCAKGFRSLIVREETCNRLLCYGSESDNFDMILSKILDVMEGKRRRSSIVVKDFTVLQCRRYKP
jgi:hypothetical protein